eukprot:324165_1
MFESSNRRHFQKGLDCEAARATRRSAQLSLRRKEREAHLQKKFRLSSSRCTQLSTNGEKHTPTLQELPKYIANILQPNDESLQLHGLTAIRILLSVERSPPTAQVIKSGAVGRIVQFLFTERGQVASEIGSKCKLEAAWIVTNIAAGTSECVACVVQYGAIKGLVELLRNASDSESMNQAIWGLGNIAGDSSQLKDMIVSNGVLSDVVRVIDSTNNFNCEIEKNAIWLMSNVFRYLNSLRVSDVESIIPVITALVRETKDDSMIVDCLWALFYLSQQSDAIVACLCENGAINICMKLLYQEVGKYEIALSQNNTTNTKDAMLKMNHKVYRPALRMIGSVLACGDGVTQMVLDAGVLDIIEPFLFHFLHAQRKEALWSLANICAGSHHQIEAVLSRRSLVERIVGAAAEEMMGCRKEACWCICNVTQDCITEQKKVLAECGAIEALCSMLAPANDLTDDNIHLIVEGLEGFLEVYGTGVWNPYAQKIEECGGLGYLEERSGDTKTNEDTWHRCVELMKKYWGPQDTDEIKQFKFGSQNACDHDQKDAENNQNVGNCNATRFEF